VATGSPAHTGIGRHLLQIAAGAALLAVVVCCCVLASTAPAASGAPHAQRASSYTTKPPKPRRHGTSCARHASFHSSSGLPGGRGASHRRTRHAACRRRHRKRARNRKRTPRHNASGTCANALLRPSGQDAELVRAATLCLVNRERTSHGEAPLRPNADLRAAAQAHSAEMANDDYFEHDSPTGATPLSRMRAAGYIFSSRIGYAVGENIAWGTLGLATPKAIVAGWMASPGHRANILDATFKDTGIGVAPRPLESLAHGEAGAIYTQDFGRIIRP
jgi:uncharacterized protein YkwD